MTSRNVFVTGAASGIGAEICRTLARRGDRICLADLNEERAQEVADSLEESPDGPHLVVKLDVGSEAQVIDGFARAERELGPISVLVASAGIFQRDADATSVTGNSLEDWELTEKINGRGTFLCVREFLRARKANPVEHGRAITFASIGAQLGVVSANVAYAASKAAVMGITKCAAREGASLGVTTNCIAPGFIETPMTAEAFDDRDAVAKTVPLGRLGKASEVAALAQFLASEEAGYITGTTIDINGGLRFN